MISNIRRNWVWIAIIVVGVGGVLGCGRATTNTVDLVEAAPTARVVTETVEVDFLDLSTRSLLGPGWALPLREKHEESLAWGVGERSEMRFFRLKVEPLTLRFRCAPYVFSDGRTQTVTFSVNGRRVGEVPLISGMQTIQVDVPAETLRAGENTLTMAYSDSQRRQMAFKKAGRDRAVGWRLLIIGPKAVVRDEAFAADRDQKTLFIPFGSRVDFWIEAGMKVLRWEELQITGTPQGSLVVSVQTGDGEERVVESLGGLAAKTEVPLPGSEFDRIRLSLAAVGNRSGSCKRRCGMILREPELTIKAAKSGGPAEPEAWAGLPTETPNVVVYLIDALRADHLGCYGYHRPVSPEIDRFAEAAVLFERAQAQTSWTRASVASIFSGLMPQVHGANDDDDALSDEVTTIAEHLRAAGFQTGGFGANGNAGPNVGFAQGFDQFQHLGPVRSEALNDAAFQWLDGIDRARPFFLWVHAVDPHAPYMPPDDLRARFAPDVADPELGEVARVEQLTIRPDRLTEKTITDLIDLYDGEIAANDRTFGAMLEGLRERGLMDNTLIVLLSDHGEEFFDHGGWTHGKTLFAEQLDVPLIVRFPGNDEGRRIDRVVQHIDVLPTILNVVGLDGPDAIQGTSLTGLMTEAGMARWENRSYSSLDLRGRVGTSVFDGDWKLIRLQHRTRGDLPQLFHKGNDSAEMENLAGVRPEVAATMAALERTLDRTLPDPIEAPVVDVSAKEEMREALRALGYVE